MSKWTHVDSEALYNVPNWGLGYFSVNDAGHIQVAPEGVDHPARIDMFELIGQIRRRGVSAPILLRFDGLLRSRVRELSEAFAKAREQYEYGGGYRPVYPIKVNQDRHIVESLLEEGRRYGLGLEAGSKPELLAVMTMQQSDPALVVCNGYKDHEYIEMALLSRKLGSETILVVEKFSELDAILESSKALDIEPIIGVRTKLGQRGSGRWQESGGDRSKFGLTTREIVSVVERLREEEMLHCLQLLHFHLGSQITNIRSLKGALREAVQTFVGLHEMGVRIRWMDTGGGLGVDYDGSRTDFESSMNYSLQEYANDVVWHLREACLEHEIEPPTILTESGRALVAHHAVLVADVLGVSDFSTDGPPGAATDQEHELVHEISDVSAGVTTKNFQEAFHDVRELRDQAMVLFNVGQLSLTDRARVEEFYWRTCEKILRITQRLDYVPDDLSSLRRDMADTYFLNFSLFQSVPDSWAIKQLFPVLPIHRLDEQPTRHAILADITCDSDGKIDRFIDLRDVKDTLELHPLKSTEPYYLGIFLVGAYQEILGDMHNLFGDTNVVHVDVDAQGRARIKTVVRGDRVQEVLSYVDYYETDLLRDMRRKVEESLEEGRLTFEESALLMRRFERGLAGYTYLSREPILAPAVLAPPPPLRTVQLENPARARRHE